MLAHFIDLEGIDQSGKKTQSHLLVTKLRRHGFKAATLDFPVYSTSAASNLAYGLAKGLDLEWLASLDSGLPKPERVVVLDVPVGSSFARKGERRDLHESNRALLLRVRRNYLKLANKFHWHVIDGTGPVEIVHSQIWKTLGIV